MCEKSAWADRGFVASRRQVITDCRFSIRDSGSQSSKSSIGNRKLKIGNVRGPLQSNFARYAYEVFVAPKQTHPSVAALTAREVLDFASVLKDVVVRFDNLWQMSFPYVMPLHQAPTDGGDYSSFHFHIEFHPPLRRPNLLKYLAGPEIGGGNFLSDTSPEEKAAELAAAGGPHYLARSS